MQHTDRFIHLPQGHKVFTRTVGSQGPKLLTIHGGPGLNHLMYANFPDHLVSAGMQVVFYDQLGSGQSGRPEDPSLWDINRFAEELHQVVVELRLQDAYVFASSWGAMLLVKYLQQHPGTFKGIILSGSPTSFQKYKDNILRLRSQLPTSVLEQFQQLEAAGMEGTEAYQGLVFTQWYARHYCQLQPFPAELMQMIQTANYAVLEHMFGLSPFFFEGPLLQEKIDRQALLKNTTPVLFIGFPQDMVFEEDYKEWVQLLPNSRYTMLSRGAHFGWCDNPEEFFPVVKKFIQEQEQHG